MSDAEGDHPIHMVHIFAQHSYHRPAVIIGNKNGLRALRDAIDLAIADGDACADLMCDDGEGYRVVVLRDGPEKANKWKEPLKWGAPYTSPDIDAGPAASVWRRAMRTIEDDTLSAHGG